MANDDPSYLNVARAATAQGYLLLPAIPNHIHPGTSFSTVLAATPRSNPFVTRTSPFEREQLETSTFVYRRADNCRGTYLSSTTSTSSSSSDHMSLTLGVSVGNAVLGASVSGSYDKAVLEDKSVGLEFVT
jgi:hypothetical protein